jgi:hypothetical protein
MRVDVQVAAMTPCLFFVKMDLANLLGQVPMLGSAMADEHVAALHQLLERQAYRKPYDQELCPLLLSLAALAKASPAARAALKARLFTALADPRSPASQALAAAQAAEDAAIASAEAAAATAAASDAAAAAPVATPVSRNIDPPLIDGEAPTSLRRQLFKLVLSVNASVKHHVSDYLWELCDASSHEYIRLTGFGNAIGLLAERGLPGFTGIAERAINLDAMKKP